jgi:hypothetical protein
MNPQQVGRAGELYVAAEMHRRGGYAVTFAGNMPAIDILASDRDLVRRITIQVKTKAKGTWHAQGSRDGAPGSRLRDETSARWPTWPPTTSTGPRSTAGARSRPASNHSPRWSPRS